MALANYDGSMTKTDKASLMKELEKLASSISVGLTNTPRNIVVIVIGMAMIQQRRQLPETFG